MNTSFMFLCPGAYTLKKRMITNNKKMGLFCYHVIPISFLFFLYQTVSIISFFKLGLLIIAFYAQYEIGYIYNDAETIKKEKEPSKRLDSIEMSFYSRYRGQIYVAHILSYSFLVIFLIFLSGDAFWWYSTFAMIVECLIFLLYNNVRGRKSLVVFFFLELFKYLPFVNLLTIDSKLLYLVLIAMIYAVPNTIERLSFKRYNIVFMQKLLPTQNTYLIFRIVFYLLASFFLLKKKKAIVLLPIFVFLLLFRSLALLKIKS